MECTRCGIRRDSPIDIEAIEEWGYCTGCDKLDFVETETTQ